MTLVEQTRQALIAAGVGSGDRLLLGYSGGPDSLCLLHLLADLRSELGLELLAGHVDHGLRPAAAEEATQACRLAAALGVACRVLRLGLDPAAPGNRQETARRARRQQLERLAERQGARWLVLAHSAQDQAETVLMRALRGAGPAGLRGMAPAEGRILRPLLGVTREQIEAYLQEQRLRPVEDPTNSTDAYLRNRLRHQVLPLLIRENPAAVASLCRLADSCREDDQALAGLARQRLDQARCPGGVGLVGLRGLPPGLLHRVLRLAYQDATGSLRHLERKHVLALASLVEGREGSKMIDLPGVRAVRGYDCLELLLRRGSAAAAVAGLAELTGPGEVRLGDGRKVVAALTPPGGSAGGLALDGGVVAFPLLIRPAVRGDRIAIGAARHRLVSRILIDKRVPRHLRPGQLVALSRGQLVAIMGVRSAYGLAPAPGAPVLSLQEVPSGTELAVDPSPLWSGLVDWSG